MIQSECHHPFFFFFFFYYTLDIFPASNTSSVRTTCSPDTCCLICHPLAGAMLFGVHFTSQCLLRHVWWNDVHMKTLISGQRLLMKDGQQQCWELDSAGIWKPCAARGRLVHFMPYKGFQKWKSDGVAGLQDAGVLIFSTEGQSEWWWFQFLCGSTVNSS